MELRALDIVFVASAGDVLIESRIVFKFSWTGLPRAEYSIKFLFERVDAADDGDCPDMWDLLLAGESYVWGGAE